MKGQSDKAMAQEAPAPNDAEKDTPDLAAEWYDRWIEKLVNPDHHISDHVLVAGYVGRSPEKGLVRIYLDAQLWFAVDIATAGILHRQQIAAPVSPLGGSYLWVTAEAWRGAKHYQRQPGCGNG